MVSGILCPDLVTLKRESHYYIFNRYEYIPLSRAVNPHLFFADPDPAVLLNADPDPAAFYCGSISSSSSQCGSGSSCYLLRIRIQLLFIADPDLAYQNL